MRKLLPAIILLVFFASCKGSKDYLSRSNEDKTLYDVVKQLNKNANDELATQALPIVYTQLQRTHTERIETYRLYPEPSRWDRILQEYRILQEMHDAIINSYASGNLVKAVSYQKEIADTRLAAAEEYYYAGVDYLNNNNREDARRAYTAFKKADSWISNFKDSRQKMDTAKENSLVNVLINPVQDNSLFFSTGWSNSSLDFNSNNLPQTLVRDLGGSNASRFPARFYTSTQAAYEEVQQGWVVDLTLWDVDIPRPAIYNYTRSVSKKVEVGKDTSGRPVEKTVYATLHIQRQSINGRAQMDINITEPAIRKNILFDSFRDTYNWQQEVASYSGDSRALSNNDWNLVNNRFNLPSKEEVLSELYRGIYPQVKNRISNAVDW
jgi:hypothetical protein